MTIELKKWERVISPCMGVIYMLGFILVLVGTMCVGIYTSIFPLPWVLIVGLSLLTHVWWMANITRRGGSSLSNWEEKDGVIYGIYCGPSMVVDGWRANS